MQRTARPDPPAASLPDIPVVEVGADFPMATLIAEEARVHALIDCATRMVPRGALRVLDAISRRWLAKWNNAYLPEIDAIAARLGRPGAYFLAVNYEWGCTVWLGPSPDGSSARLARTLDWVTEGLGRYVIAAHVAGSAGPFVALTWPGFTGVLQGLAPGRFSATLNQAPMRRLGGGFYPLDWAVNRVRVWRMPHPMPVHLLRQVFETAHSYDEAKDMLATARIAAPAIFTLAGVEPNQTCRIERTEEEARVSLGVVCASNHWQAEDWDGRPRGYDSFGRLEAMGKIDAMEFDSSFDWLVAPLLNPLTRLAMVSDAREGRLIARGFEKGKPATSVLHWP